MTDDTSQKWISKDSVGKPICVGDKVRTTKDLNIEGIIIECGSEFNVWQINSPDHIEVVSAGKHICLPTKHLELVE